MMTPAGRVVYVLAASSGSRRLFALDPESPTGAVRAFASPETHNVSGFAVRQDGKLWLMSVTQTTHGTLVITSIDLVLFDPATDSATVVDLPGWKHGVNVLTGPENSAWLVNFSERTIQRADEHGALVSYAFPRNGSFNGPWWAASSPAGQLWYTFETDANLYISTLSR